MKQLTFCMVLLAVFALPAAAAENFAYQKLKFDHQLAEIRRSDGTVTPARFLGEMILLRDGRANGGFGIWEQSSPGSLTLYRVVEGKNNGPFFTFRGQRLFPLPAQQITVSLDTDKNIVPAGSVRFLVDSGGVQLNLAPVGSISSGSGAVSVIDSEFSFANLNAPPQTVEVSSVTDIVISSFNSAGLVFPTVGAIGLFNLTNPGGPPGQYHYGTGVYKTMDGGLTWLLMATAENNLTPTDGIMIMVRPEPGSTEPCRIYDIAGTNTPSLKHFEAATVVTSYKIGEW